MARTHTTAKQHFILYSLICLLVLGVGTALGGAGETPRRGGTLRVGTWAEPPSLDAHRLGPVVAHFFTGHYLEGLDAQGLDYGSVPMLAEGHTVFAPLA